MSLKIRRRQLLVSVGLAWLWPRGVWACGPSPALSDLLSHCSCCVVGRAVVSESHWTELGGKQRIVTVHEFEIDDVLHGQATPGETLRVRTLGGQVGDVVERVFGDAELQPQQPTLLFLSRVDDALHVVTGMAGGCFPIRPNAHGEATMHALHANAAQSDAGGSAASLLEGVSVPEMRELLLRAGSELRAH